MTMQCSDYQQRVPRSLLGDLSADEQQALDLHLAACPSCRQERDSYAETLRLMRSAEDEPVPRHFFVYPQERATGPWQLFRAMSFRWQALAAGAAACFVLLGVLSVAGVRVQADSNAWILSFGRSDTTAGSDVAALKAEMLRAAEERDRELAREWIRGLQSEMEQFRSELTSQQQTQLAAAMTSLEERFNSRITLTAGDLRGATQKSIVDLYRAVSQQHGQDFATINARLDSAVERSETRANQTDAILDTLLQIANQNIKQNGDQK